MKLSDTIELLPAEEYAKRFCVSRTTVFEWKKSGILTPGRHYIKIGRTLRFVWYSGLIRDAFEGIIRWIRKLFRRAHVFPLIQIIT